MKPGTTFVAGGGWVIRRAVGRRKARFFAVLALVWSPVCVSAGVIVGSAELSLLSQRACIVLLALELVFIAIAVGFAVIEKPREIAKYVPNPDCDKHNLY